MKTCLILFFLYSSAYSMHLLSEVKVSYFYSTNADFKNIYSSGGGLYRLETSLEAYKNLYPFLSVGYFETSGHSQGQQSPTKLKMVPISPGLKYFFLEKCIVRQCDKSRGLRGEAPFFLFMKNCSQFCS